MIVSPIRGGKNTKDATIVPDDVAYGKVAYGKDGKVIGTSPLSFIEDRTSVKLPNDEQYWSNIRYLNNRFIALSRFSKNAFATSTDGTNWIISSVNAEGWQDVCFGNGKFVAIASSKYAVSMDGINWTVGSLPMYDVRWICFGNGKFIVVSDDGGVAYSTNGINWTGVSGSSSVKGCIYYSEDLNMFVVVPSGFSPTTSISWYSTDGINWYESSFYKSVNCHSLIYSKGKFIATSSGNNSNSGIAYSTDGINWVEASVPVWGFNGFSICYGDGKFLSVDSDSVMYSTDGIEWEASLATLSTFAMVCYGGDKFVSIDTEGNFYYSFDGKEWFNILSNNYSIKAPIEGLSLEAAGCSSRELVVSRKEGVWTQISTLESRGGDGLVYGNGKFLFSNDDQIYVSEDNGVSWTSNTLPDNYYPSYLVYGNDVFVAFDSFEDGILYSNDGMNWIKITITVPGTWSQLCYSGGKFVIYSRNSNVLVYSNDGVSWETFETSMSGFYFIFYGKDKFVASTGGGLAYSYDGLNWILTDTPEGAWYSGCYGDNYYVIAVDDGSSVAVSSDGILWEKVDIISFGGDEYRFIYPKLYYSCGIMILLPGTADVNSELFPKNFAIYSLDGVTWNTFNLPYGEWRGIAYGDGRFIALRSGLNDSSGKDSIWCKEYTPFLTFADEPVINAEEVKF